MLNWHTIASGLDVINICKAVMHKKLVLFIKELHIGILIKRTSFLRITGLRISFITLTNASGLCEVRMIFLS